VNGEARVEFFRAVATKTAKGCQLPSQVFLRTVPVNHAEIFYSVCLSYFTDFFLHNL
jgi:hypothetical protein